MNKSRFLQELQKITDEKSLEADAVRLYLLLLANCRGTGCGKVSRSMISSALGGNFSFVALKAACHSLRENGLLESFRFQSEEEIDHSFTMTYRLLTVTDAFC
ncbi:MAG: hypothetical protein WDA20_10060 [Desulfuromonadales bacterium]